MVSNLVEGCRVKSKDLNLGSLIPNPYKLFLLQKCLFKITIKQKF